MNFFIIFFCIGISMVLYVGQIDANRLCVGKLIGRAAKTFACGVAQGVAIDFAKDGIQRMRGQQEKTNHPKQHQIASQEQRGGFQNFLSKYTKKRF